MELTDKWGTPLIISDVYKALVGKKVTVYLSSGALIERAILEEYSGGHILRLVEYYIDSKKYTTYVHASNVVAILDFTDAKEQENGT